MVKVLDLQDQSTLGRLGRKSITGHRYFYKSHTQWRHYKNQVFPRSEHFSPFCMFHCVQPFRATRHAPRDTWRVKRKWHRLREVPHFLMDSRPRIDRITRVRVIATREEGDTQKEFSLLPPRLASPRARGFSREPAMFRSLNYPSGKWVSTR